jgi:hydroxymethylglutaryl-CoA lyase
MGTLKKNPDVSYKATCANVKAVERALADLDAGHGADEISLLVSASEAHTQKNLNRTRAEQWQNIEEMVRAAQGRFRLVGTVSVAFGCPFEGRVDAGVVIEDVQRFEELGVELIALGDTTGMATPVAVRDMLGFVSAEHIVAHFHDTRGTGLVNYVAAYEAGVRYFDCSFGGVGGHPAKVKYGGGFTGNVCTEDLVNLFESMGIGTGIDLDGLLATAEFCEQTLGRELYGRVTRSGLSPLVA